MENSLSMDLSAEEAAKFRDFLRQGLAEMDRNFELMARDQIEIDRLAASSQANLAQIQAISEQTDAVLATLKWS